MLLKIKVELVLIHFFINAFIPEKLSTQYTM